MSQFVEMFGNTPMSYEMQDCFSLIRNGANIKQGQFEGGIPITRIETISDEIVDRQKMGYAGIADNKYELYYLQDGDILISHINSLKHIGKCALYNKKENESIIHGMNLLCLRPNIVTINPVFAIHMLRSNIIRKGITDITKPAVNQASFSAKDFGKLRTIIPPMDKQMLFVSIAEQADKSKFGDFKSQFIEMFGNPVTNTKGWKTAKIKDVAPEMPSKEQLSGKIWLLNLDMIESDTGRIIEKVYEDVENALSVQSFDEGNVLFSKLRPYLNKVVIPDEPGMATTELVPLRPEPSKLHKVFLSHLLRGNQFVNYANDIAGGTKMPRMPLTELRNFDCILPPMDKQLEFVFIAEQVDKSKSVIQKALVYLNDIQSDELGKIA
ncbi:restriction endonuclease subunit S [Bacteroides caccae]|uniref:restriction endonuclease subunit S n=2 Tax=Bacteroides caccae TaxID=47678 RepID=UPI0034A44F39